jgi:alpha-N-arabinofuranosidase
LRDALVAGITLNIFHAHADRVRMANIAQAVNVLQAMLLTDGNKLAKTPTYYTFAMYTPFQDATFIPVNAPAPMLKAESGSFPAFTVSAARAKDGKTYVAVANADKDKGYKLSLDLGTLKGTKVSGQVLTAAKLDAHTPGQKEEIAPAL